MEGTTLNGKPRPCLVAWAPILIAAAGCAGQGSTTAFATPPLSSAAAARATDSPNTASGAYVYACTLAPKCSVFTTDGQLVRTTRKGLSQPSAIVADTQGNVYVSDPINGRVVAYSPGMEKVTGTLSGVAVGFDMAIHAGTIAVGGGNTVTVFPAGSSTPTILTDPDAEQGNGIAFDSHGNCYFSVMLNDGHGTIRVDEFAGCAGSAIPLDIPGSPMWLAIDGNDNLYYVNFSVDKHSAGIYRCNGITQCTLAFARGASPRAIRFDQGWQHLYVADLRGQGISRINIATGKVDEKFTRGFKGYSAPIAVAAGPGPN
jgi:sugar lactone lactonase YvrE